MNFGSRLRELRMGQKWTQQLLADRLGVAKSVISYYESGDRFPSNDVLIRIARTFHVSIDYLLGLEHSKILDVSDLTDHEISVLEMVANTFRENARNGV